MTAEDDRAAAYRAQAVRRAAAIANRIKGLRGSDSARRALEERWAPVINRTRDTEEPL